MFGGSPVRYWERDTYSPALRDTTVDGMVWVALANATASGWLAAAAAAEPAPTVNAATATRAVTLPASR